MSKLSIFRKIFVELEEIFSDKSATKGVALGENMVEQNTYYLCPSIKRDLKLDGMEFADMVALYLRFRNEMPPLF